MRRLPIAILAATWALAVATAHAQGDLSGVTMRVLDDVSDIDAVILALDANRGEDEEGAEPEGSGADEAGAGERNAAETGEPQQERGDERREDLHDPGVDERSEGKLEDNDVESPEVPAAP